jgi:hypothetical protein
MRKSDLTKKVETLVLPEFRYCQSTRAFEPDSVRTATGQLPGDDEWSRNAHCSAA